MTQFDNNIWNYQAKYSHFGRSTFDFEQTYGAATFGSATIDAMEYKSSYQRHKEVIKYAYTNRQ